MALPIGQFDGKTPFYHPAADERTIGESARSDEVAGTVAVETLAAQTLGA